MQYGLEKKAIVIDLSNNITRYGFAGETAERGHCPNPVDMDKGRTSAEWTQALLPLLHNIILKKLLTKPRDRNVLVLCPISSSTSFYHSVKTCLLEYLQVQSMRAVPLLCTVLYPSANPHGVVVDLGHSEARILCMSYGLVLMRSLRITWIPLASEKTEILEAFFPKTRGPDSLVFQILDSILQCDLEVRPLVVQNVTLVGGNAMISGFHDKLENELRESAAAQPRFKTLIALLDRFLCVPRFKVPAQTLGWLGGSIYACLDDFSQSSVSHTSENYTVNELGLRTTKTKTKTKTKQQAKDDLQVLTYEQDPLPRLVHLNSIEN